MNALSTAFFLLGLAAAFLFAIGMDPYSCGIPLCLIGAAVIFSCYRGDFSWAKSWMSFIVFLTVGYFAYRMSQSSVQDFGRSDGLLLAGVIGAYWWTMSQKIPSLKWVIFLLWGVLIANIAVAAVQAYVDVNFYPIYGERATLTYPSGLYLHYNHFSNFMLGIGLLSMGIAFDGDRGRMMRIVSWLMYFIALYGVVLSNSRGAIFGLGAGTVVACLGWLMSLWRRKVAWAGMALVTSIALAPILVAGAWQLGESAIARRGMGDGGRLELAAMAIDMIVEKPLWGGGSRCFFFDSLTKWDTQELYLGSHEVQYVHNEYLQAAVDYGLVGAGLLLVIFCATFFRGVAFLTMSQKNDGGDNGFVIGSIAALVGMGVQAFFSFVYHVLPDLMLMSICLALIIRQPWIFSKRLAVRVDFSRNWVMSSLAVLLGLGMIGFAARDGAAWFILRPQPEQANQLIEEKIFNLKQALQVRPDFRVMSDLTKAMCEMTADEKMTFEQRKKLVEEAIVIQNELVRLVPQSYHARLNLALMYDSAFRFDESSWLYKGILDDNLIIEVIYGVRYHYARHLFARAHLVWRKRDPERALAYFHQARGIAAESKHTEHRADAAALVLEIEKCIKFLEGANIKPAEINE
jgi:O-antigen ligase